MRLPFYEGSVRDAWSVIQSPVASRWIRAVAFREVMRKGDFGPEGAEANPALLWTGDAEVKSVLNAFWQEYRKNARWDRGLVYRRSGLASLVRLQKYEGIAREVDEIAGEWIGVNHFFVDYPQR